MQFPTVTGVRVFVDGKKFDWCVASDAGQGEGRWAKKPKFWDTTL
jgi:hypothetical protein